MHELLTSHTLVRSAGCDKKGLKSQQYKQNDTISVMNLQQSDPISAVQLEYSGRFNGYIGPELDSTPQPPCN